MAPFSFLFWILNFINYYFNYFVTANSNYVRSIITGTRLTPLSPNEQKKEYFYLENHSLVFSLTSEGFAEGYTSKDLPLLIASWCELGQLSNLLKYRQYFHYLNFQNY